MLHLILQFLQTVLHSFSFLFHAISHFAVFIFHWLWSVLLFSIAVVPGVIPFIFYTITRYTVKPLVILFAGRKAWLRLARRGRHANIRARQIWKRVPQTGKITLIAAGVLLLALAVWIFIVFR